MRCGAIIGRSWGGGEEEKGGCHGGKTVPTAWSGSKLRVVRSTDDALGQNNGKKRRGVPQAGGKRRRGDQPDVRQQRHVDVRYISYDNQVGSKTVNATVHSENGFVWWCCRENLLTTSGWGASYQGERGARRRVTKSNGQRGKSQVKGRVRREQGVNLNLAGGKETRRTGEGGSHVVGDECSSSALQGTWHITLETEEGGGCSCFACLGC